MSTSGHGITHDSQQLRSPAQGLCKTGTTNMQAWMKEGPLTSGMDEQYVGS